MLGVPTRNSPVADPLAPSPMTSADPHARGVSRGQRWLVAILLLLFAGVVAVWLDARNGQRQLRTELAKRLGEIDSGDQATRAAIKDAQENLRDVQAKAALLENRVAESQSQQAALEALYRELTPTRDEWALTEVEQILILASQQLQLAGNVPGALTAMQLADTKLQRLDRPQFVSLRRALARDMDRLKAVPFVDVSGLSLRLDQAIAGIDALPLANDGRVQTAPATEPPKAEAPWRVFLHGLWQDVRRLVRIERIDQPEPPLLAPEQQFFLRENLKLRLLSARFELLFHDPVNFRADLAAADALLVRYFDVKSRQVVALQMLLRQLKGTDMATELPGLAGSLDAVRSLQLARDKASR